MGASIESGSEPSRNVELNIIPFIDLLSCLTAFLLVTAVWVGTAQLETTVEGRARDVIKPPSDEPQLSVLVDADEIWIGVSRLNEFERIPTTSTGHDWSQLATLLRAHKTSALFGDTTQVQVAASSTVAAPVPYQAMIQALDVAVQAGFVDVQVTDPGGLAAQPRL